MRENQSNQNQHSYQGHHNCHYQNSNNLGNGNAGNFSSRYSMTPQFADAPPTPTNSNGGYAENTAVNCDESKSDNNNMNMQNKPQVAFTHSPMYPQQQNNDEQPVISPSPYAYQIPRNAPPPNMSNMQPPPMHYNQYYHSHHGGGGINNNNHQYPPHSYYPSPAAATSGHHSSSAQSTSDSYGMNNMNHHHHPYFNSNYEPSMPPGPSLVSPYSNNGNGNHLVEPPTPQSLPPPHHSQMTQTAMCQHPHYPLPPRKLLHSPMYHVHHNHTITNGKSISTNGIANKNIDNTVVNSDGTTTKPKPKKGRPKVDPSEGHPKRPLSAYNLFFRDERNKLLETIPSNSNDEITEDNAKNVDNNSEQTANGKRKRGRPRGPNYVKPKPAHGKISFQNLAKMVGSLWNDTSEEIKQSFKDRAAVEMKNYKIEMEKFHLRKAREAATKSSQEFPGTMGNITEKEGRSIEVIAPSSSKKPKKENSGNNKDFNNSDGTAENSNNKVGAMDVSPAAAFNDDAHSGNLSSPAITAFNSNNNACYSSNNGVYHLSSPNNGCNNHHYYPGPDTCNSSQQQPGDGVNIFSPSVHGQPVQGGTKTWISGPEGGFNFGVNA